jgi:hypothetical protein
MPFRAIIVALCASAALAAPVAAGITIDHTNFDPSGLPQTTMDLIGDLTVYFAHASVGGNMTGGMDILHGQNATRYQLLTPSDDATPPATPVAGNLYEYNRGNPGWQAKVDDFETYMSNGWGDGRVDIVMNKFCYIDQAANLAYYTNSMSALETTYPNAVFVYMTIPLMETCGADGLLRQQFNAGLRTWCAANDKVLFDIADIEAWSPTGVEQTVLYSGTVCQVMYDNYSHDGGHLYNVAYSGEPYSGAERVAMGLYSLYGAIAVPEPATMGLLGVGLAALLRRRKQ